MAKQKFPAPATTTKNKKPEPQKEEVQVEGKKSKLVQVEYKKDNHHVLIGVHSLRKGINHVASDVWEESKKHPAVQHLIEQGHIVCGSDDEFEEKSESQDEEQKGDSKDDSEEDGEE